jgi:transposase
MRAYSRELREQMIAAVDAGAAQTAVAERFGVDVRTVRRYLAKRRATGSIEAEGHHGGRPARIRPEQERQLLRVLQQYPTATLAELSARWQRTTGTSISAATMSRTIQRLGWQRAYGRWQPHRHSMANARPHGTLEQDRLLLPHDVHVVPDRIHDREIESGSGRAAGQLRDRTFQPFEHALVPDDPQGIEQTG